MNTLSSNPKKTMFYVAAQNMLNQHQSQSSMQNLKRSLFQLALVQNNQKEQLNLSLNNNSDRAQANYSLPRRSNIFQQDRDRSTSYKLNLSIDKNGSLERLQNAYNIKGHFQVMNEDPNLVQEKEQKKLELKEYLLKQIEEKKKQQKFDQQRKQIEDAKAEELVKKQLEEIRMRQKSKFENQNTQQQQQGSIWLIYYYIRKIWNCQQKIGFYNSCQCLHIKMDYLCKYINKNKIMVNNKMTYQKNQITFKQQSKQQIQNDLHTMQYTQQQQINNVTSVRSNIQSMLKKQSSMNNEQMRMAHKNIIPLNEKLLDCETIFIPANSKINTEFDHQNQFYSQASQDINKSSNSLNQNNNNNNNSFQHQQQLNNMSTISNPINNSQHYNSQPLNQQSASLVNHSRMTISQLTSRDRSLSHDKKIDKSTENLLAKVDELKDEIRMQKPKKPVQNNIQLKLPHRTTMLMQIPSKMQTQSSKQDEPKSSQRI